MQLLQKSLASESPINDGEGRPLPKKQWEGTPAAALTRLEMVTLVLAANGLANRDIAYLLETTEDQVKNILRPALEKTGMEKRIALVQWWKEYGTELLSYQRKRHGDWARGDGK